MKWILSSLVFLLPLFAFSQNDYAPKNGIGIHLTQDESAGLGTSLRYTRQIANQGTLKFEFRTNWNSEFAVRLGYEFLQLRIDKFELGLGLDLKYQHYSFENFAQHNYHELALELPIELRYQISPRYTLQTGVSFAYRLRSSEGSSYSSTSLAELRVGIGYKF